MKRWLILLACCLQGLCLRAAEAMLTHEWRAETSRPAATSVTLRQGETVRLACTLVEHAMPVTVPDDASSRFFWKDADADGNAYWSADAELEGNVVSFVWSPDRDAGCRRYAFFLSVESPSQGTIYRAFGLLVMQASPGFDPADLGAPDALQTFVEAVIDAIDGRYLIEETDPTVPAWAKAETKPSYAWSEIAGKPATYAPSAHTHAVSDVSGLQTALDEKQPAGDYARISGDWTEPDEIVIPEHVRLAEIFGDKLRLRVTDMSKSELLFVCDYFDDTGAISRSESCNVYQSARVDELLAGLQTALTFDEEPTEGSTNPAKSGGIFAWVKNLLAGYLPLTGGTVTGKTTIMGTTFQNKGWILTTELSEGGKWLKEKYAFKAHTHAVSDISGLQTALDAKAPVSAVSMSEGGTDYVWVWDPNVGTFALTAGGAAPVYPAED